ncbi:MAG: type III secretion system export apparatus subunit SctU [Acidobacteriota bacterium]|nr:type III secretion system export apparatus subunit SctU [Blastocatellia bacterium]MDW8411873.1 type III secretion system export apparatus subunit SctU [Acidobacteriota bacterium]
MAEGQGGEKTEKPTPKRIKDARKKGNVAKSKDLTGAILFLAVVMLLAVLNDFNAAVLMEYVRESILLAFKIEQFDLHTTKELFSLGGLTMFKVLAPVLASAFVLALAIEFMQVGALFTTETLKPKFDKLNPVNGFKGIFFQKKTYIELLKTIFKIVILVALFYAIFEDYLGLLVLAARRSLWYSAGLTGEILFDIAVKVGGFFLAIGVADFGLQRHLWIKDLMMSKYEVKQEYKQDEGDPHHKAARKRLHRELLQHSAVQDVKKADVVIVNPTHIAVAIRYNKDEMAAPQIVAKGQMLMAEKILEIARENNIPIMRNVPLAHALNKLEEGEEIPEELYEAVAEVLNWVYRLHRQQSE